MTKDMGKDNKFTAGILILMAAVSSCGGSNSTNTDTEAVKDTVVLVHTAKADKEDGMTDLTYFATVSYIREFEYAPQTDGIATDIRIRPGQKVTEGQVLVDYPVQGHALRVEQMREVIADLDTKLEKQKVLLSKGFVSKQAVEDIELELKGRRKELNLLEDMYLVKAPFSGTITDVAVTEGDHVAVGYPMFILAETDRLSAEFFVSYRELREIREGDETWLMLEEYDRMSGEVKHVSRTMDATRKAYRIRAEFPNPQGNALGGAIARVRVGVASAGNHVRIPLTAIASAGGQDIVYKFIGGHAVGIPVQIISIKGQWAVVEGALSQGEEYITEGIGKISDGTAVKPVER